MAHLQSRLQELSCDYTGYSDAAQCSVTYKVDVHILHELEVGVRACLSNLV